jgi:hypothetical protein
MDQLEEFHYFTCPVYAVKKPEFLEPIRKLSKKYLDKSKACKKNKTPMTVMTQNFSLDEEAKEFAQYVSQTAWNILDSQGYNVDQAVTYFTEMWTQEHNFHSAIDQHFHGSGSQMSAFYFLEVPEKSCKMVIHDPRPAKVIIGLPEKNHGEITQAANTIVFAPEAGTIIFTPAWLPHSFSRNLNKTKPVMFVHMNLSISPAPDEVQSNVEVI